MITIAVANQKGGVGKTTTAVTLAHGLALRGYATLLVDLDSQGNVADCLGMAAGNELGELLLNDSPRRGGVESGRSNLYVIRADKGAVQLKAQLAGDGLAGLRLAAALEGMPYEACLIDCAPSVDLMHTAALLAADWLLVPTRLDQLAVKGVRDILQSSASVSRLARKQVRLAGILPTFYDRVTSESHEQLAHLAETFGEAVLPPVPVDTVCRAATRAGRTLWEHAPRCRALTGVLNGNGRRVGGYRQALERVLGQCIAG